MRGIEGAWKEDAMTDMLEYMRNVEALALNIYHEARGESDAGKIAVALATRNRVEDKRWPDNYFEVIWQKKQFSWTIPYEKYPLEGRQEIAIEKIKDEKAFKKCLEIAAWVARGGGEDFTKGANHYNTKGVDPSWDDDMELTLVVGEHEFFKG
jgi:N-acetylmuramoyl-L-alanine amidase